MKTKIIVGVIIVMAIFLNQSYFFVSVDERPIIMLRAADGLDFKIRFIHSVQRTPVEEYFSITEDKQFRLTKTKYQSFGVGLPFLEQEGRFHQEGNYFIMEMSRIYPELSLRTGVDSKLTIYLQNQEYKLYELFPLGTKFDIYIAPLYNVIWRNDNAKFK